jgi:MFS transporter, OFA family, oxalate/formate antiporter
MLLWKRILNTLASFVIMLCIGGVYAWSIVASELIDNYNFTVSQSQLIFGTLIAVFPVTMIIVGSFFYRLRFRYLGYIAGVLFFLGFFLAGRSQGNFTLILFGIGVLVGIATGFGYWLSLTLSVISFPARKGLAMGIVTAGFGLGAVVISKLLEIMLNQDADILDIFERIGLSYGLIIAVFSSLIGYNPQSFFVVRSTTRISVLIKSRGFLKLLTGLFMGTFAGLFVIGSLKIIGSPSDIDSHYLYLAISVFAVTNFLGRLFWGSISDYLGASLSIFLALLTQALSIYVLLILDHNNLSLLLNAGMIGMAFGGNFVLFAKEASQIFGEERFGSVYPIIFLGYALAGIASPMIGGLMYDLTGTFRYSIMTAGTMSLIGSLLFLKSYMAERRNDRKG